MARVPRIDRVSFLVNRKFNEFRTRSHGSNALISYSDSDFASFDLNLKFHLPDAKLKEAERYHAQLQVMGSSELEELYLQETHCKFLEEDQTRFFYSKMVVADFDYWSKMSHWTLDEAIALSFGKDPERVNWNSLSSTPAYLSPFVKNYAKLGVLTTRAVKWEKLYDPVLPSIFVNWVILNEISFPSELMELVNKRSGGVEDWKKLYVELLDKYDSNLNLIARQQNIIEETPGDLQNKLSEATSGDGYIPSYIKFLLGAVSALNLSANNRVNKEEIVHWLDENWPVELEGKSDRLINSMATILRRPEDKKGGNTSWS